MRKATLSKLAKLIIIAQVLMSIMTTVAQANTCEKVEYFNPSKGKVITAIVCYDATIADDEIDDSVEVSETIINERDPKFGETGFKG